MNNRVKHTLLVAACVAFGTQFHFTLFVQGFIITLSVIVFSVFNYYYTELDPIKTGIVTGIISPTYRGLMVFFEIGNSRTAFQMVAPDAVFYFTYGIVFYLLYYRNPKKDLTRFALTVMACDFLSNVMEMTVRTKLYGMNGKIVQGLLIIAAIRTLIVVFIIIALKYYKSFLVKDEHEARYRSLMLLTSSFKSEIYFMYKNMAEIEDVMKKSYSAYKIVTENNYPDEVKNLALDIAKDVHEIKKEYLRVIKGLEEMSKDNIDITCMHIRDLVSILETDTREYIRTEKLNIAMRVDVNTDFYVRQHFYLMSVLKNLMNNSIEAMEDKKNGILELYMTEREGTVTIVVADNGSGIKESNFDYIFNPGFSTKFDKSTGNIGRGIGLTLVRDLVRDAFMGEISVRSEENKGTRFEIRIPKSVFEEGTA